MPCETCRNCGVCDETVEGEVCEECFACMPMDEWVGKWEKRTNSDEYYEGECEECGDITQVIDNEKHGIRVCDGCFDTDFSRCERCDATYRHENMGIYCETCEELKCEDCEEIFDEDQLEHGYCDDCLDKHTYKKILKIVPEKKHKLKIVGVYEN